MSAIISYHWLHSANPQPSVPMGLEIEVQDLMLTDRHPLKFRQVHIYTRGVEIIDRLTDKLSQSLGQELLLELVTT